MARLTERAKFGIVGNNEKVSNYPLYKVADDDPLDHGITRQCFEKLADYEDAEEQGLLLRLPCPIGGTIWHWVYPTIVHEDGSTRTVCDKKRAVVKPMKFALCHLDSFGDLYFLTKEEAEAALQAMKEGE